MPPLEFAAAILWQVCGSLAALGIHGSPCPWQEETGGRPSTAGPHLVGRLSGPASVGGSGTTFQLSTLPPPLPVLTMRNFSFFSRSFRYWSHIHPSDVFLRHSLQVTMAQGRNGPAEGSGQGVSHILLAPLSYSTCPSPEFNGQGFEHFFSACRKSIVLLIMVLEPRCVGSDLTPPLTVSGVAQQVFNLPLPKSHPL